METYQAEGRSDLMSTYMILIICDWSRVEWPHREQYVCLIIWIPAMPENTDAKLSVPLLQRAGILVEEDGARWKPKERWAVPALPRVPM